MNFNLFGRESARVSQESAERVSNWSLDRSEADRSIHRKIDAAATSTALLDDGETRLLLSILDEMEKQEKQKQPKPGELPSDLRELQRATRAALS